MFNSIPYKGYVYNCYYNDNRIIRALNIIDIITNLEAITDYSLPFILTLPEYYYDTTLNQNFKLDDYPYEGTSNTNLVLDTPVEGEASVWTLDEIAVNKKVNHLCVEFRINSLYQESSGSTKYLLNPNYYNYLKDGVDYNRKTTEVGHVGAQLSFIVDDDVAYFNALSSETTYSVPDIEMKCQTTPYYYYPTISAINLDDGKYLDSEFKWYLDQKGNVQKTKLDKFYWLVAGIGTLPCYSDVYSNVFDDIIAYWSFDRNTGQNTTIYDSSINSYHGTLYGTVDDDTRVDILLGNAIYLNGTDNYILMENINITNDDKTISFWINALDIMQSGNTPVIMYIDDFLKVEYDKSVSGSEVFNITISGDSGSVTLTYTHKLASTDLFFLIEVNVSSSTCVLYVNDVSQDTDSLATVGNISGTYDIYLGSNDGSNNFYTGYLDEIKIYDNILTSNEKSYLYDNRIGDMFHLDNEIYRQRIEVDEITQDNTSVTNEVLGVGDGSTTIFNFTTANPKILLTTFKLKYNIGTASYEVTADENGNLSSSNITNGTVDFYGNVSVEFTTAPNNSENITCDYDYGIWDIIQSYIKSNTVKSQEIMTGDGVIDSLTSQTTLYSNIIPYSFKIEYENTNSVNKTYEDNGSGSFDYTDFSGDINYTTGIYNLYFYKQNSITDENLGTGDGSTTSFSLTTQYNNVQRSTFYIKYIIGGVSYVGQTTASGVISGTGISSGTITTGGVVTIVFSSAIDVNEDIDCDYEYRVYSIPKNNAKVYLTYKTETDIEITEVGIENNDNELITYATFPAFKPYDEYNHLAVHFFIKKY